MLTAPTPEKKFEVFVQYVMARESPLNR